MDYKKETEKFVDSMVDACLDMDFSTFADTTSWSEYDPLIAQSWTKRILSMIDALDASPLSQKEKAFLFPTMSELRCETLFNMWMAKYADVTASDRERIMEFYIDLLHAATVEDPYAVLKNKIHSGAEIKEFLKDVKLATPEDARALGRLVNAAYHFSHAAYSDMNPDIVYENYGPYEAPSKFGEGAIVVVKEFGNLRCPDLWPETKEIPHDSFRIVVVYQGVRLRVDAVSHAVYEGDLINGLTHMAFSIDDSLALTKDALPLAKILEEKASAIFKKFIKEAPLEEKKRIYYHTKAYAQKKVYDYLGQPWQPSEEILAEAQGRPLREATIPEDKKKKHAWLKKMLLPHEELPDGA